LSRAVGSTGTLHRPCPKGGLDRAFTVPVSAPVRELLAGRRAANAGLGDCEGRDGRAGGDGGWVFPARDRAGRLTHVVEPKEQRQIAGRKRRHLPSPHRLRDTFASAAHEARVHPLDLKVLMNHALPAADDVTEGYIRPSLEHLRCAVDAIGAFPCELTCFPVPARAQVLVRQGLAAQWPRREGRPFVRARVQRTWLREPTCQAHGSKSVRFSWRAWAILDDPRAVAVDESVAGTAARTSASGDLPVNLNRSILRDGYRRSLKAYVRDYLKEEVFDEGLTRNVPAFSRFFEAMAFSHGQLTNYANIARDCGVDAKTVKEYYRILEDTLLGTTIQPFAKRRGREVIQKAGKFFLFDVGVAGHLVKRHLATDRGEDFGRAFKHFVLMEILAHRSYRELDHDVRFWRTKTGLEVDYVLGSGEVAIEVKGGRRIDAADFRPLAAFIEDHRPRLALLVCNEARPRKHGDILVLPWRDFLERLWGGQIVG
jgi:hypothetical protein